MRPRALPGNLHTIAYGGFNAQEMRETFVDHARGRGYRHPVACRGMGGGCSDGLLSRVAHAAEFQPRPSRQARPIDFVGCQGNLAAGSLDRPLHDRDRRRFAVRQPASAIAAALEALTIPRLRLAGVEDRPLCPTVKLSAPRSTYLLSQSIWRLVEGSRINLKLRHQA